MKLLQKNLLEEIAHYYALAFAIDLLTSFNGQPITYDGAGNPTNYKGSSLTWKNGRQLASYGSNTYDYDYAGIRTRKNDTYYYVEGDRILAEIGKNGLIWYYYDESGVCGMNYNNADYYFEKNILGDVVAIYNRHGETMGVYFYNAWGESMGIARINPVIDINPFRYRGYYYDTETKLYYLNSRYYDPEVGRFINADEPTMLYSEAVATGGANLFSYCYNNPVMYTDPSGHGIFVAIALISLATLVGAGATYGGISAAASGDNIWEGIWQGATVGGLLWVSGMSIVGGIMLGPTTYAGSGLLSYGISTMSNFIEVALLQSKKNGYDGVNSATGANNIRKALFGNSKNIMFGGTYSAFGKDNAFGGLRLLSKIWWGANLLGGKSTSQWWLVSYALATLDVMHLLDALLRNYSPSASYRWGLY